MINFGLRVVLEIERRRQGRRGERVELMNKPPFSEEVRDSRNKCKQIDRRQNKFWTKEQNKKSVSIQEQCQTNK